MYEAQIDFIKDLTLNTIPWCNAMRNLPSWIVTRGTQNSVPLCIATPTWYIAVFTFEFQVSTEIDHHHLCESAMQVAYPECGYVVLLCNFIWIYTHSSHNAGSDGTLFWYPMSQHQSWWSIDFFYKYCLNQVLAGWTLHLVVSFSLHNINQSDRTQLHFIVIDREPKSNYSNLWKYYTDASIVPPFFHVKYWVLK